jgi:hypothetical protein
VIGGRRPDLSRARGAILSRTMIDRVALDALMLRAQFPDLRLREGASVVARVASRAETHGVIVLAGVPLTAELPPEVRAGETLHLRVQDVSDERVTLRLESQAPQAPPLTDPGVPAAPARPARLAVEEPPRRPAGGDEASAGVALSFDSAVLGRLDLRVDLTRGSVQASVTAPAGPAFELATEAAARLQDALAARTARPAGVRVSARRQPFDAYA